MLGMMQLNAATARQSRQPAPAIALLDRKASTPCPLSLLFISSGSPTDPSAPAGNALFTAKEARCFPETSFGFVCLPSARHSARQGVLASPWLSRWRLHRHTRTLKRNPVVFRPRAARTDDGARRPAETPRSFRCRRAEPIAPRECPCPAKDAFGTGGNNRGTKQGSVSYQLAFY